jgi:hypothetical protein
MSDDDSELAFEDSNFSENSDISAFESVSVDEVVQYEVNLTVVRDKARLSFNGPLGVADQVITHVIENHEDKIDKRYATQSGRKIGEISVRGDGTIVECDIDGRYTQE